jgi:hypothetical protein
MKRLIALMLCALMILFGCARHDTVLPPEPETFTLTGAEEYAEYSPPMPFRYGRSLMEGEMAALYDRIWTFLSQPGADDNAIPVGNALTDSEIAYTMTIFRRENPIYYWADFSAHGKYILVTYKIPPEEIERQRQAIDARAAEILEPIRNASPFEMALAIHDALAVIPYSSNESLPDRDNLYGTLVRGAAICGGYASSFLYLTELAGLESVFIAGESKRGVSHAWNAVRLNGSWHFVDVTWNRPGGKFDDVYHSYFLIDTKTLRMGRYWDEKQYPVMPEPGDGFRDYYQRMGYSVSGDAPYNAVEIMADVFYKQILNSQSFPTRAQPVYLELRVSDSSEVYDKWKDLFIKHLFDILRMIHARELEEGADFIVADLNRISCDYDDVAQVLVFYPIISEL